MEPPTQSNPTSHRRIWIIGLLVVAAGAAAIVIGVTRRPPRPAQHVILISLDTTRADHFGCYGNTWIRTPRIDALAAESILLTDYMTAISTTLPSHTSLFTGKYPHTHGVPRNGFVVNDQNVTLAEVLKQAGFRTAGFLGSFALDSRFNVAQGFDRYDESFTMLVGDRGADQNQRRARTVTDAVIDYLDTAGVPRNLFLFVHYFDPHMPYDPLPPYNTMYGEAPGAIRPQNHPAYLNGEPPQKGRGHLFRHAGEVSYMDEHVGRLLDDLKRRGILDNALLIVTSDHGENLGDNSGRRFDHGWTTYQCVMRAVGMIRLPGAARGGTRVDLPLASIDVLPTVATFLGLPIPAGVEGTALDLENLGGVQFERPRFGEAAKPWDTVETDPRWKNLRKQRCVRRGRFKFIQTLYRGTEELYDLVADPHEHFNLLRNPDADTLERAKELRGLLATWAESAQPLPSHFESSQRDESIRRLKALGYLGGDDGEEDEEDPEGADETEDADQPPP